MVLDELATVGPEEVGEPSEVPGVEQGPLPAATGSHATRECVDCAPALPLADLDLDAPLPMGGCLACEAGRVRNEKSFSRTSQRIFVWESHV